MYVKKTLSDVISSLVKCLKNLLSIVMSTLHAFARMLARFTRLNMVSNQGRENNSTTRQEKVRVSY